MYSDSGRLGVHSVCSSPLPSLGVLALGDAFSDWCFRDWIIAACVARDNRNLLSVSSQPLYSFVASGGVRKIF